MRCEEVHAMLLDAAEEVLAPERAVVLDEHMASCARCRERLDALKGASVALRQAVSQVAPPTSYLTARRRERLLAACAQKREPVRLITWRRFAAAAAAAAIIASAPFIVSDVRELLSPLPVAPVTVAVAPAVEPVAPQYVAMVNDTMDLPGPGRPVCCVPVSLGAPEPVEATPVQRRLVRSDTPGVVMPVQHVFYDPQESSRWW